MRSTSGQHHLEMKQVERPQPPPLRIRGLNHGEDATRFQHARDQGGQASMLFRIECLQSERRDDEVGALRRQIACQHVILNEFDPVGTVGVKPLDGATMHAGGDVDGGDGSDILEALQQMRPDFTGTGHQIVAVSCAGRRRRHRRHALLTPALGKTERADQAEGDVPIRAAIKYGLHELRVIDIGHSVAFAPTRTQLSPCIVRADLAERRLGRNTPEPCHRAAPCVDPMGRSTLRAIGPLTCSGPQRRVSAS